LNTRERRGGWGTWIRRPRACPHSQALDLGTQQLPPSSLPRSPPRPDRGGFRVVDSFSRIVRLGEGWRRPGGCRRRRWTARRPRCAPAPTSSAAGRCAARGRGDRGLPPRDQRPAFLARIEAETGLRLRIISAREEAELAMESCAPLLETQDRRALLFDIGGGSPRSPGSACRPARPRRRRS
jgi:exopolyphosphatase / guanosine-5'-triphosphate,3'-diphosphate pyrophosphatase